MKNLAAELLGDTRAALLAVLLLRPDEARHVRELARLTGVSPGTLHRELTALTALGILKREAVGRQVYFSANQGSPVFGDLAGLLRRTAGLVDVVRQALAPVADRLHGAFVYGSMAAGTAGPTSDVDVMLVGDLSFEDAVRALAPVQATLQRDVNPSVMTVAEFERRREARDGFVTSVLGAPRLWVIGGDDESR